MRESDLPQVLEIERDAYPTPWTHSHFRFEIRDMFGECGGLILIA